MRKQSKSWLLRLLGLALMCALAIAAGVAWWLQAPLPLASERVELSIEVGTPASEVARDWVAAGVQTSPELLAQWFRWSGQAKQIRAGSYRAQVGDNPRSLLSRMVRGEQTLETVRLIEGWNFRQVRDALARAPQLRQTLAGLSDAEVAAAIGSPELEAIEGQLFPDTYAYSRGVTDLTVLKRAHAAMRSHVATVWSQRASDSPLRSPEELLVLASVVEKETGAAADRGLIAGVFTNRLRIGMPLQSDPTVIYSLGERFDGNLRKTDLQTDAPWNTYTRRGLPPTPIAMPGLQALKAAARPAPTPALYFVARGDGSSAFSTNLADHNRAVNQFQRANRR